MSKQRPLTKEEPTTLAKLIPSATVRSEDGSISVEVTPLPLKKISLVSKAFSKIFTLKQEGKDDLTIILGALDDILEMVQHCVTVDLNEIPATMAPDIALIFLQQNLSETTVKKWKALGAEAARRFSPAQSELKTPSEKSPQRS
jgi:hypothetical protein